MDCETIYEANGEVVPMNSLNVNIDNNNTVSEYCEVADENVENMQSFFSKGMTDDAIIDYIFSSCDKEKYGFVQANELVDFFLKISGSNEICDKFCELKIMLDPTDVNPLVDVKTFQYILKSWIARIIPCLEDSKSQLYDSFSSKADVEIRSEEVTDEAFDSDKLLTSDMNELKHLCDKLQKDNKLLQIQTMDIEESSCLLRAENSKLEQKMIKLESEIADNEKQTKVLQEDNIQLQDKLLQATDELQQLKKHYNQCRNEVEENIREVEVLQLNFFKEKDRSKSLLQTIQELEDLIHSKEEALLSKDKEIQCIAKDLMDQQLMSDPSLTSSMYARRAQVTGDTLAFELQSSFAPLVPWKSSPIPDRLGDSDFFHRAEWNVMITEPEFEEHVENSSASDIHSNQSSTPLFVGDFNKHNIGLGIPECKNLDRIQSTSDCSSQRILDQDQVNSGILAYSKWLFWILFYFCWILTALTFIAGWCWMLLSLLFSTDCGANDAKTYYHSSPWTEVIESIQPYCHMEYHGYPPV